MLSVVVLTKNEEKDIKQCLKTLAWCDEVVVVDDYSDDKTVELAKKEGARAFIRPLIGNFAAQRNFGLGKARGDWVLFVDADERVSVALATEIQNLKFKIKSYAGVRAEFRRISTIRAFRESVGHARLKHRQKVKTQIKN